MLKPIRVIYKKLKDMYGEADLGCNRVYIDRTIKGIKHLEILLHESLHILYPKAPEDEIVNSSIRLAKTLWSQGYRRVDIDQGHTALQDGTL
jgi:hypothetical protein